MSRRPATFLQSDVRRAIRAAKAEGAPVVEVRTGEASIIIRLQSTDEDKALEPAQEIEL
jgi:hypothetical protein